MSTKAPNPFDEAPNPFDAASNPFDPATTIDRPLTGKVARVLNARELIVNIGSDAGVNKGTRFKVLAEDALEVSDPETEKPLGAIDLEKTRVQAVDVRARFSVCRTYRMLGLPRRSTNPYRRPVPPVEGHPASRDTACGRFDLPPPLPPDESYVKIGDRVVAVDDPAD